MVISKVFYSCLTVHVNVNNRVQDANQFTPLHLCVQNGNEIILRNLVTTKKMISLEIRENFVFFSLQLLAGTNINDVTANRRSALHIAAENNRADLCVVFFSRIKFMRIYSMSIKIMVER